MAIVCSDLKRNVVVWSRAAEQIFGYIAEETMGRRTMLVPPEATDESQALFERCLTGEAVRDLEVRRRRKDGSMVDVELAARELRRIDGAFPKGAAIRERLPGMSPVSR